MSKHPYQASIYIQTNTTLTSNADKEQKQQIFIESS